MIIAKTLENSSLNLTFNIVVIIKKDLKQEECVTVPREPF